MFEIIRDGPDEPLLFDHGLACNVKLLTTSSSPHMAPTDSPHSIARDSWGSLTSRNSCRSLGRALDPGSAATLGLTVLTDASVRVKRTHVEYVQPERARPKLALLQPATCQGRTNARRRSPYPERHRPWNGGRPCRGGSGAWVTRARVTQLLDLTLLAPDIQEGIGASRLPAE
jgi:hypothetical protein